MVIFVAPSISPIVSAVPPLFNFNKFANECFDIVEKYTCDCTKDKKKKLNDAQSGGMNDVKSKT